MENTWRPCSSFISGFSRCCHARRREHLVFEPQPWRAVIIRNLSPPVPTCPWLLFSFPMEAGCSQGKAWVCLPAGMHWRQQRKMEDGWRMVSSCCCFSLCVKMSPLIQPPPMPLPQPSLRLLSLFVSEMIPSVMSKATLSYSCCLGNQRRERQRLKAFTVFEAGKHERLSVVLRELES